MGRLPGGGRGVAGVSAAASLAALVAVAGAEPPQSAGTAAARLPHVRVIVHKADRATLQRRNAIRLTVRSTGPGFVRISTTHKIREGTRLPRIRTAKRRVIQFRRRGSRRVRLPLTAAGRRLLGACRRVRVRIAVRVFRRNRAGRRRAHGSTHTRHSMRHVDIESPLCPESNVVGDTRNPTGGGGPPGGGGGPGSGALRAGAAASDITPPIGTPMFAYTNRSGVANPPRLLQIVADPDENLYAKSFEPSDGIHTRVLARSLVIEQGGEKFALVQTDLGGLPYALLQEVGRRVAATGISEDHIMLSATHTHGSTGPIWPQDSAGYAALGGDFFDPRVFDLTAEGIAESIRVANGNLEPARVGVGSAEIHDASRNRRFEPFQHNHEVEHLAEPEQRARSIDPTVTVIRADALGGGPIGIWTNFAIHATSLGDDNLLFTGDNPATAERLAETLIAREAGREGLAPPPDRPMVNVWTNASEGDISPNGDPDNPDGDPLQYVPSGFASANLAGTRVAEGTVEAWRAAGNDLRPNIEIGTRRTIFELDGSPGDNDRPVGPNAVLGGGGITFPNRTCAPVRDMAGPGQGFKFPLVGGRGLVPEYSPVALWRIGDLGIGTFPLEITRMMGARIQGTVVAASGGALEKVVIAGLTNGYQSYTATPEEYNQCFYEGSFTLFGEEQGSRFRNVAMSLVGPLLSGGPAPASAEPPPPGFNPGPPSKVRSTSDAGTAVEQPAGEVTRMRTATFQWRGGDPSVDPGRNTTFVSLQRRIAGEWATVGTDEGYFDTTTLGDRNGPWLENWQFTECDPLGSYRFHVSGRAQMDGDSEIESYTRDSDPFQLRPITNIGIIDAIVDGGTARVRARYPEPPPFSRDPVTGFVRGSILVLPRRVRTGTATLRVRDPEGGVSTVIARPDAAGLAFIAGVPEGSSIESVSVEDDCGNTGP